MSVFMILWALSFVLLVINAIGKLPPWPSVLVLLVIELLRIQGFVGK